MKSSHTLYCPIHALAADCEMQEVPRDWKILRTLTASRSVILVWNPKTRRVSPQYNAVFVNDFSTVPFMVAGTDPPHWGDLVDTQEQAHHHDVNLADTRLSGNIPIWVNRIIYPIPSQ